MGNAVRAVKLLIVICCLGLWGCVALEFFTSEGPPSYEQISESYEQTKLKTSGSADALTTIHIPEYELLSQSKSVVASVGQKKKGYKTWLKMVAFDEDELTAQRKYLLIVDERPKVLFVEPWTGLSFDCEMVLESEVLDEPYANENARRIAILKQVLANVQKDVEEVGSDNKTLNTCGMLINQALTTVLVKLDSSPVLASRLSEPAGLEFDHISLDKGKIEMLIENDIVAVKMRLGSLVKKFKISFEKDIDEK